jgi:hypothetical protein
VLVALPIDDACQSGAVHLAERSGSQGFFFEFGELAG